MTDIIPPEARHPASRPAPFAGYAAPYLEYAEEDSLNLLEYWEILRAERKLLGIIVGAVTLLALVYALISPPVYRAEVLVAPVSSSKTDGLSSLLSQFGDLSTLADAYLGGSGKDKTSESVATMRSRSLSLAFIQQQGIKPLLFSDKWNSQQKQWKNENDVPTDWDAFTVFHESIRSINTDRRTGLVTVAMEWEDPALAAKWANELVRQVNERRRAEAIEDAQRSISYLQKQLTTTSTVEIQQAIYRLIEAQTKTIMVASTRDEYAFKVIDPAVTPEKRVRPKRLLIVTSGLLIGTMLALFAVIIRERLRRKANQIP